ncbi:hypothetical protein PSH66_18190 [Pseudomonas sp. FP597]|uniref:hypothetical protein n=1 Tax=Pseudomonas sp. FP597 TaxID=2954096 RepID=UPI0027374AB6|nr:hypothetical protein [Pseudomonas sp. FP597]WLI04539.1 hypothetical protein PSH66_18190 [Pseudomonas sp. FP597]
MKTFRGCTQLKINKYYDRMESLISAYRDAGLKQFEGPGNKKAEFDDRIWYYIDPNTGRQIRYLCGIHGRRGKGNAGNLPSDALPYPYDHLIKVWIIEVANTNLSAGEKQARVSVARKVLSLMDGDLFAQSESSIRSLNLGRRSADRLRPFFDFCTKSGLMRRIDLTGSDNRDRTGHAYVDNVLEKLPDITTVLALGAIFSSVFEHVDENGTPHFGEEIKMLDALIVTFTLLSLASPNRTSAEIPLLPKQKLHSHSEGNGAPVYYLDWIGSKGYHNNKNHVLSALAEPITKATNFFFRACEPARVLCRFYEKPNLSLRALLGTYEIAPELKKNLCLSQRPNLFTLGYALGFYEVDDRVPVLKEGVDPTSVSCFQRGRCFEEKPIYSLRFEDRLSVSNNGKTNLSALPFLFGYSNPPKMFTGRITATVGEVQDWWISFYKKSILPEFPLSFSTGESYINLKDAMFCFLGSWFYGMPSRKGSGGKTFQRSNYSVVPLASLGHSINYRLGRSQMVSIFASYGFSSDLNLSPHNLRHLADTLADLSNIPVELITAWSGRKSSEQTHTYIHTSDDEKASRVSAIMNPPEIDKRSIRVFAQEKLAIATNLPASLTSTGLCTQNLNVTPCNYLNDFVSHCFMCPETCHVAGDKKAIELFEKDLAFQVARIESVVNDPRLSTSSAMQKWYVIHSRNTHVLSLLIDLMRSSHSGMTIRYSNKKSEFSLVDLNSMVIKKTACALPDFEACLSGIIESKVANAKSDINPELSSLLSSFGLSDKEV